MARSYVRVETIEAKKAEAMVGLNGVVVETLYVFRCAWHLSREISLEIT